ncbi:MAG: hypothetical protein N2259_00615 [Patescibacteria group bacterium]|nr:hypothetical protein [Patescibacteria group bacterium]
MKNNQIKNFIIFGLSLGCFVPLLFFLPKAAQAITTATLRIAHNDGVQCYLNNLEVINTLSEPQTHRYWNKEINVKNYLQSGRNLLACRVSNGDGNPGTGIGYFDLELKVDSQTIIASRSGDWKYFGQSGKTTPPSIDSYGRTWFHPYYDDSSWRTGSTPFGGWGASILGQAPDDGWFRKSFTISFDESISQNCPRFTDRLTCLNYGCWWYNSACFNNPPPINCAQFNNETTCFNRGCWWHGTECSNSPRPPEKIGFSPFGCIRPTIHRFGQYKDLSRGPYQITLEDYQPLITGLVKYGNRVEIYVDNQSIGKAVVKEGEDSGIANFYFKPKGTIVPSTDQLNFHRLKIVAVNPLDQSLCANELVSFRIKPYPAPIIHRLGEIPYVMRANKLTIKTKNPLVTGLVKSGSVVEVFVDNQSVGQAKIQKGKEMDNFYLTLPTLSLGQHSLYAIAKKAGAESIVSAPSQIFEFTVRE